MTDIKQLIERLREKAESTKDAANFVSDEGNERAWALLSVEAALWRDAATALESLSAENAELREALKPATEIVEVLDRHLSDDWVPVQTSYVVALSKALAKLEGSGA